MKIECKNRSLCGRTDRSFVSEVFKLKVISNRVNNWKAIFSGAASGSSLPDKEYKLLLREEEIVVSSA